MDVFIKAKRRIHPVKQYKVRWAGLLKLPDLEARMTTASKSIGAELLSVSPTKQLPPVEALWFFGLSIGRTRLLAFKSLKMTHVARNNLSFFWLLPFFQGVYAHEARKK
jgi:hypothetical protein